MSLTHTPDWSQLRPDLAHSMEQMSSRQLLTGWSDILDLVDDYLLGILRWPPSCKAISAAFTSMTSKMVFLSSTTQVPTISRRGHAGVTHGEPGHDAQLGAELHSAGLAGGCGCCQPQAQQEAWQAKAQQQASSTSQPCSAARCSSHALKCAFRQFTSPAGSAVTVRTAPSQGSCSSTSKTLGSGGRGPTRAAGTVLSVCFLTGSGLVVCQC